MDFSLALIQKSLLENPEETPSHGDWADAGKGGGQAVPAAVLVAIVERPTAYQLLLTRRTDHLRDHPGQISFPGGRMEQEDRSPVEAALREAKEEIGLDPSLPRILGHLPSYRTVTGFQIYPVVSLLCPPFQLLKDDFEVAEVFEVPFDFLMNPENHRRERLRYKGVLREYTAIPYQGYNIWGATAGMIASFSARLKAAFEAEYFRGAKV